MADNEYIPSTETVRAIVGGSRPSSVERRRRTFDRWYAAEIAAAEARGAAVQREKDAQIAEAEASTFEYGTHEEGWPVVNLNNVAAAIRSQSTTEGNPA